jgi:uncharacterized protein
MDFLTGNNDIGTLGLGLLVAGTAAGLVSGVLGRGAGLILVPALFLVAHDAGIPPDLRLKLAIGTSFACILPLALATARDGNPDRGALKCWALPLLLGLGAGMTLYLLAPVEVLVVVFAVAALAAATLTISVKNESTGAIRPLRLGLAFLHGGLAAALGLGGGSLGIPMMMLTGAPRETASATAAPFAVVIAAVGAIAAVTAGWDAHGLPQYSYGFVNLFAFAAVAPAAFAANRIAAHFAGALDTRNLRLLFAAFVVLSTAKMVWVAVG